MSKWVQAQKKFSEVSVKIGAPVMGSEEVTRLLVDWSRGDAAAFDKLALIVYKELHQLAQRYRRKERQDLTLQATDLVHEAYLRLVHVDRIDWQSRTHFFAISARMMRRVLIDYARSHSYLKRGGHAHHVQFDEARIPCWNQMLTSWLWTML